MGMPDAELYPHASGAAGALVEQHKSEAEVKFYAGCVQAGGGGRGQPGANGGWTFLKGRHGAKQP